MKLGDLASSPAWLLAGWSMLHFLWVGAILGGLAAVGRFALRGARVEVRYGFALGSLIALALAPAAIALQLWATSDPIPSPFDPAASEVEIGRIGMVQGETAGPPDLGGVEAMTPADVSSRRPISPDRARAEAMESMTASSLLMRIARALPCLWLVGAPITFAFLGLGLAGAERLRRASRPVSDPRLVGLVARLSGSIGLAKRVALAACDRVATPVLVGLLRPSILLPASALSGWSPEQLEWAILHELMHVRRRDNLSLLFQRLVESALFFHPAVWLISGWVHRDREPCCDAAVVRLAGRPRAYAEALLALAAPKPKPLRPTAIAMAESPLVDRIRRLLQPAEESDAMKFSKAPLALTAATFLAPAAFFAASTVVGSSGVPSRDDPPPAAGAKPQDDSARAALAEAIRALEASERKPDTDALEDIAETQLLLGDREAADETLRQAVEVAAKSKQSVHKVNEHVTSYGQSSAYRLYLVARDQADLGDQEGARESLRLALAADDPQNPEQIRFETLGLIARLFSKLGDREEATSVAGRADREFEAMDFKQHVQYVLPQIAGVHVAAGDDEGAFALLDRVEDSDLHPMVSQSVLGSALSKMVEAVEGMDEASARPVLDRIAKRLDDIELARNKSSALGELAAVLAGLGDYEAAIESARKISREPAGDHSNLEDFEAYALIRVATAQRRAGDDEEALRTLATAFEVASRIDEDGRKSGRIQTVAEQMALLGDFEGALHCVEALEPGRRNDPLVEIAALKQASGAEADAGDLFRRAIEDIQVAAEQGPPPPPPGLRFQEPMSREEWKARMVWNEAKIRARMGDFEVARVLADGIADASIRGFALADVARLQAASGDAAGALAWCRDLEQPPTHPTFLQAVILGIGDHARGRDDGAP